MTNANYGALRNKLDRAGEAYAKLPIPSICGGCFKDCVRGRYKSHPSGCHAFGVRPADDGDKCWGFSNDPNWARDMGEAVDAYGKGAKE